MRDRSAGRADGHFANPNYKSDVNYTLEMCRWVTKPIGVWPFVYSRTSKLEKLMSIVLLTVCFSDLLFSIIPPGHHAIFVEKNVYVIVKLLAPIGFGLSSAIKYLYLVFKGNVFKRCLVHVERDWKTVVDQRYRQIMVRQSSVSRQLIVLCAIFLYSGGMSYQTIMPFVSKRKMRGNQTLRPLIYPGYDAFFDSQASPTYEIIFSMLCLSGFIRYSITTSACSLAATFVTHICGQVQIQIARLENLAESSRRNTGRNPVAIIVREHVEILRFSKNVEEALREICLTEIVGSTFILCVLEYYCLVEWQNKDAVAIFTYVMFVISFTFNITIFCYIGELLTEECSKIGPAAYEIDWYNLPYKKAHDLILMSVVSNYPPKLTAGKIITLSLNTFSSVGIIIIILDCGFYVFMTKLCRFNLKQEKYYKNIEASMYYFQSFKIVQMLKKKVMQSSVVYFNLLRQVMD